MEKKRTKDIEQMLEQAAVRGGMRRLAGDPEADGRRWLAARRRRKTLTLTAAHTVTLAFMLVAVQATVQRAEAPVEYNKVTVGAGADPAQALACAKEIFSA